MGIFGRILNKLGFGEADSSASAAPPGGKAPAQAPASPAAASAGSTAPAAGAGAVSPGTSVDVLAKLQGMAAQHPEKLNWKTSIVDLLKLLGLDSSLAARRELAGELGCPPEKMADSAQMNQWLHQAVMQRLAANGGNIPADLLH